MPRYEVEVQMDATVWIDVEAENEEQAEDDARDIARISDAQWWQISDMSVKQYADEPTL